MRKSLIVVLASFLTLCVSCNFENMPEAHVGGGTYDGTVTVELSCSSRNSMIYYTLDGSDPKIRGIEYTGPISITYSCKLRFVARNRRGAWSSVVDELYAITGSPNCLIFYDCDADNDETNNGAGPDNLKSSECGWRYLEAAPEDITKGAISTFVFGYYRESSNVSNWYVNGTISYEEGTAVDNDGKCTGTAIGTGKANTTKLVDVMGSETYSGVLGSDTTRDYAAILCDECTDVGHVDWFLPSRDELIVMYINLAQNGLGGFASAKYWSSSEYDYDYADYAWSFHLGLWYEQGCYRNDQFRVRPIRVFQPE